MTFIQMYPLFRQYAQLYAECGERYSTTMISCCFMWLWRGLISPCFWAIIAWCIMDEQATRSSDYGLVMGATLVLFIIIRYWKLYWFREWLLRTWPDTKKK